MDTPIIGYNPEVLTVGSLFSGIGGLDLGLERAGMQVRWQSEIDPYCSRVLAKHWLTVPNLGDIKTVDWSQVERIDLICGGYPCQPFSLAGGRCGTDDERHLWPYMRDAIGVLRPRLALLENVPGHLSLGFGDVLADLADLGYDTEWDCIPAAAVGAPHLRYRVFIVAHANGDGYGRTENARRAGRVDGRDEGTSRERERSRSQFGDRSATLADTQGHGCPKLPQGLDSEAFLGGGSRTSRRTTRGDSAARVRDVERTAADGETHVAQSECERLERPKLFGERLPIGEWAGDAGWWATEPDVGRVAYGVPSRVDRLRALGNAVVPQVAEFIGRRILEAVS